MGTEVVDLRDGSLITGIEGGGGGGRRKAINWEGRGKPHFTPTKKWGGLEKFKSCLKGVGHRKC